MNYNPLNNTVEQNKKQLAQVKARALQKIQTQDPAVVSFDYRNIEHMKAYAQELGALVGVSIDVRAIDPKGKNAYAELGGNIKMLSNSDYSDEELEGVFLHEVAHIVYGDPTKILYGSVALIVSVAAVTIAVLVFDCLPDLGDSYSLQMHLIATVSLNLYWWPLFLVATFFKRSMEKRADAYAKAWGVGPALADALKRMTDQSNIRVKILGTIEYLLGISTHPSTASRVRKLVD